ncbi:cache domain-containing sensor histidine kinase [Clostridium tertium]|uniref:cache domain-containing sensor histidine kinase n=1 Tax=Clostridium tertium TaxID=1559 RepID=UPI001AE1443A|nr:histidine kinase [Clostridium tertium]MBP1870103.1 two-component system sensor histidine kinase YesM [Clostridium tertium]
MGKIKSLNIWKYIKEYRFNSILVKYFITINLFITFPLFLSLFIAFYHLNNIYKDQIVNANLAALSRTKDSIDMISRQVETTLLSLATDLEVENILRFNSRNYDEKNSDMLKSINNIEKVINTYVYYGDFINSICIYSEKSDYKVVTSNMSYIDWKYSDTLEKEFHKNISKSYWTSVIPEKNTISFFRAIPLYSNEKSGVVVVSIDIDRINKLINQNKDFTIEDFYILNNDSIIFNKDTKLLNQKITSVKALQGINISNLGKGNTITIGGREYFINNIKSNYNDWNFISLISTKDNKLRVNRIRDIMIGFLIFSISLVLIISFLIAVKLFTPIEEIVRILEKKNYDIIPIYSKSNINELKIISRGLENSISDVQYLKEELNNRMRLLKKARSIALQSQINSHFLFNTLENIKWKVMEFTNGENEGSHMISNLSKLLRISLNTKGYMNTLKNEIEHVNIYLEIQKIRYDNKFEVVYNIQEETLEAMLPKITLQPIVENAIYHGIKPTNKKCTVTIRSFLLKDRILIEVDDDGAGMEEETSRSINNELKTEYIKEENHIGIKNVNQRIKLSFGENYGIEIKSKVDIGTSIIISIPSDYKINSNET